MKKSKKKTQEIWSVWTGQYLYIKGKTKQQQNKKSILCETNKKILLEIYEYNFKN